MRNSIYHPKNDSEGIRSHNPTKLLCLSRKKKRTLVNNVTFHRDVLAKKLQPLPWDDSKGFAGSFWFSDTPRGSGNNAWFSF